MISYQTDGVEMPSIKKRETTEWIKSVAATYGKRVGEIAYIFCSARCAYLSSFVIRYAYER